jgi:hypothetical protein
MSHVQPNRRRYLLSIAEELSTQSNRVRDLIGDRHWLSDGHHKEYVLLELLRRHVPFGVIASRGFVIALNNPSLRSTEQDILVIDALAEGPVFNQGGLIISFPSSVLAALSVKTKMDADSIVDSIKGLNTVRNVAALEADSRAIWCGAYYFEEDPALVRAPEKGYDHILRGIDANAVTFPSTPPAHPVPRGPDLHCSSKHLAYKLQHGYQSDARTKIPARVIGYDCGGLASALFLGDLLDHISAARKSTEADFTHFADQPEIVPFAVASKDLPEVQAS